MEPIIKEKKEKEDVPYGKIRVVFSENNSWKQTKK